VQVFCHRADPDNNLSSEVCPDQHQDLVRGRVGVGVSDHYPDLNVTGSDFNPKVPSLGNVPPCSCHAFEEGVESVRPQGIEAHLTASIHGHHNGFVLEEGFGGLKTISLRSRVSVRVSARAIIKFK